MAVWTRQRRHESNPLNRVTSLEVAGKRPHGRPRKSCRRTVEEDMHVVGAQEEYALDQARWRGLIETPRLIISKFQLQ